jgi:hypothetical protein
MKIVNVIGGLGNQMFQYAFAIAISRRFPEQQTKITTQAFRGYPLHNGFEIERIFSTPLSHANYKELLHCGYPFFNYRSWQICSHLLPKRKQMCIELFDSNFRSDVLSRPDYTYYDGYWQNEKYFVDYAEDVRKTFTFPSFDEDNHHVAAFLQSEESVSIHVRRGDYLGIGAYSGICTIDYYREAILEIKRQCSSVSLFCIFSDDVDWCTRHLSPLMGQTPFKIVDWNKDKNSFRDMQLMSCCKHNIIANSSFSWWGAWLNSNPNKIVIAPRKWSNKSNCISPACTSWIKL